MSLDNLFGKPILVNDFGDVHPVKLKNWDEFEVNVNPVILGKSHLQLNIDADLPLLDRLVLGLQDERVIASLCKVFNIASQSKSFHLEILDESYYFVNENKQIINNQNYEEIRNIILRQNVLFEPKVYKSVALQKWADKVLQARGKNAPNVTIEDMLSTISVLTGKHYWELEEYTIYQLKYDFNRICRIKNYETQSLMYANPYADLSNFKLDHFAENIDMYENPYEGLFKEKSSVMKLDGALQDR